MAPAGVSSSSSLPASSWEFCGGRSRCSFKAATILVCSCNIMAALYVLHLLRPGHFFWSSSSSTLALFRSSSVKYTDAQINRMSEALDIWKKAEPVDLVKRVQEIQNESSTGLLDDEQMEELREDVIAELTRRSEEFKAAENLSRQRLKGGSGMILDSLKVYPWIHLTMHNRHAALQEWRQTKLAEIKLRGEGARLKHWNAETQQEVRTAEGMKYLLLAGWSSLLEEIGGWDDAVDEGEEVPSDTEIEKGIIPGRKVPSECHAEAHTDYDGAAVRWGLTFHVENAADCCQACLDQAKSAKPDQKKCNIWVYCPDQAGCYSPDIYEHKHQECWLKQSDKPQLNFRGKYPPEYRRRHPTAPFVVPWVSGVTSSA